MYSKKVDKGSVAWHSMCLYSSTNLSVHFSTSVVVCKGDGSATTWQSNKQTININSYLYKAKYTHHKANCQPIIIDSDYSEATEDKN